MKKRTNVIFGLEPLCEQRCSCRKFLLECAEKLSDDGMVYPLCALLELDELIFSKLNHCAAWCVHREFRKYAEEQLSDEHWTKHWEKQKERDRLNLQ
jgi:hypothetical protein